MNGVLIGLTAAPVSLLLLLGAGFSVMEEQPEARASAVIRGPGTPPQPYTGGATGCTFPDPTGTGGCVTAATAWLVAQVAGRVHRGPASCWDAHAWNPLSDHPRGRACDYAIGRIGHRPDQVETAEGWRLAAWLRAYARPLHVAYVIWQGRIWSAARDDEGWRTYFGGGVYDPADVTGGHYDHIHVSLTD